MGGVVVESGRFDWRGSGRFPFLAGPDPAYHGLDFVETFGDFPTNAFHILKGSRPCLFAWSAMWPMRPGLPRSCPDHRRSSGFPMRGWRTARSANSPPDTCRGGAGSVFTFGLRGGYEAGVRVVEGVDLWSYLANVGDTRSLILHPASTTHRQLTDEERTAAGAGPDVIRLSVGIEDAADLIADLNQALVAAMEGE